MSIDKGRTRGTAHGSGRRNAPLVLSACRRRQEKDARRCSGNFFMLGPSTNKLAKQAIKVAGSPILSAVARAVEASDFKERRSAAALSMLVAKMATVLAAENGKGLAAPQVGEPLRIFLLDHSEPTGSEVPLVCVNPRIIRRSKSRNFQWESCLSVPGRAGIVERADRVDVEYQIVDWAELLHNRDPQLQSSRHVFDGCANRLIE